MCAKEVKERLFNIVKNQLESHNMLAYDHWIEGFVDFFMDRNIEEILDQSIEQWILNDLRVICPGSLPHNMNTLRVLNGKYILQINGAMDISTPAYQQYLKLKKIDTGNVEATTKLEEKISSKRMYKLDLTDGKQNIEAIEYETINLFDNEIIPGSKIFIAGPVQCRYGMLLLTNKSVENIAGEVEKMYVKHSLAVQLYTKLNLDVDKVEGSTAPIATAVNNDPSSTTTSTAQQNNVRDHEINVHTVQNRLEIVTNNNVEMQDRPQRVININRESVIVENFGKRQLEIENTALSNAEKRMRVDVVVSNDDGYPDDADFADVPSEDENHCRDIEKQFEEKFNESITRELVTGPKILATSPYVYIKQINELPESEKMGKVFRVKGQVLRVLTNLTLTDKWNLKCAITDGTGCMDVEFSSNILSGFLRNTPEDIKILKNSNEDKATIMEKIKSAYRDTAETLQTLYCIIEVTMHSPPTITRLIEFEDTHVIALKHRFHASGISSDR